MTPHKTRINRRAFLVASGTTGVVLPFLEGLPTRSAFAQSAADKPAFGFFICTANGVQQQNGNEPERFWPTTVGPLTKEGMQGFASERATGILADHAHRLLVVRGINLPSASPRSCGHAEGLAQTLTARAPSGSGNGSTSSGISVDTRIAEKLNPAGVAPLTTYCGRKYYIPERLSFSAAGQARAAEGNPYNVYTRLSGLLDQTTGQPTPMADQLALRRNSVNDLIREQITDLMTNPKLSKADVDRLDLHFDSIRDVETDMQGMAAATCTEDAVDKAALSAINGGNAFRANENFEKVVKLHADLVALTFACNANQVATLQAGDGTDGTNYTVDGRVVENFHHISHRVNSDGPSGSAIAGAVDLHAKIDRIRMETFRSILDKWSEFSTPNGPLLDNAFIYWTSHIAIGPSHSMANVPIIIAGSAGGKLAQGQYIDGARTTNAAVLMGLLSAMGIDETFGTGANGPLTGMLKA